MQLFRSIFALSLITALMMMPSLSEGQENVVNRQDVDRIFALNLAEWNQQAKQFQHPPGWEVRVSPPLDTGTAVMAFDPKSGTGLSLQPLFHNAQKPPDMLILSNLFPPGTFPEFSEKMKQEMEAAARTDLGPAYAVRISFSRTASPAPGFDKIDIVITPTER
jgi:hypothetical protein